MADRPSPPHDADARRANAASAVDRTRREFLTHIGVGLAVGLTTGPLAAFAQSPVDRGQTTAGGAGGQPPTVRFPPIYKPTERREGQPQNPQPPDQQVGYALVGLGGRGSTWCCRR